MSIQVLPQNHQKKEIEYNLDYPDFSIIVEVT